MTYAWVYDKESFFDFLGFMIVHAPEFPEEDFLEPHEQLSLESAFEQLKKGLAIVAGSLTEIEIAAMNLNQGVLSSNRRNEHNIASKSPISPFLMVARPRRLDECSRSSTQDQHTERVD